MGRLNGKNAVVTGGGRGIGFAIAKKLAGEGAHVIIADVIAEQAENAVKQLNDMGMSASYVLMDVSKVSSIYEAADTLKAQFKKIDILVNNAGVAGPCPSMQASEEYFDRIMDINIKGTFFCSQAFGRIMRKNGGGCIVSISSGNSWSSHLGRIAYCVSKRGVNAMTAVLGAEWAMYHIRVNAVAPGFLMTEMVKHAIAVKSVDESQMLSVLPAERLGEVGEVADAVCYLCSDEASYIVGQTIFVDGGWSTGILPNALDYIKENDIIDY